jgi:hypothetical protein
LEGVKNLVVDWMRSDIKERAKELRHVRGHLPETIYEQRKRGILASLKSLVPGGSKEIAAMTREDETIATEAKDIASLLNMHWQQVFNHKPTNAKLRSSWLQNVRGKFRVSKEKLRPSRRIVRDVIANCGSSAPGPDAVPFEIYRAMGEDAVELFCEMANAMLDGTAEPDDDFNVALMVCIPKAADGFLDDSTPYFKPGGTRPISIVDASNRILASIFCVVLEKEIRHRIDKSQKGFLKGRKMLRNVLEVDLASHKISIRSRSGAMILFDFKAAFPSLAHEMIWDVLEATGVDTDFIRVVKAFYRNNKHLLKFRGMMFEGVSVESGVRQGCPLSGLLFAICVDVLITRLNGILKRDEVVDAFADDIAVVVDSF